MYCVVLGVDQYLRNNEPELRHDDVEADANRSEKLTG